MLDRISGHILCIVVYSVVYCALYPVVYCVIYCVKSLLIKYKTTCEDQALVVYDCEQIYFLDQSAIHIVSCDVHVNK